MNHENNLIRRLEKVEPVLDLGGGVAGSDNGSTMQTERHDALHRSSLCKINHKYCYTILPLPVFLTDIPYAPS